MDDRARSHAPRRRRRRPGRPFGELRLHGLLWAINRYLLHPRGFALALHFDDGTDAENDLTAPPTGWSILGDGSETWNFTEADDDRLMRAFEAFLGEHHARTRDAFRPSSPLAAQLGREPTADEALDDAARASNVLPPGVHPGPAHMPRPVDPPRPDHRPYA